MYITFLDSYDLLDPNYLECQLEFIKDYGLRISTGYRRKALHKCTDFLAHDYVDYKTLLKGNHLSCLTTMYDREVIREVYFPDSVLSKQELGQFRTDQPKFVYLDKMHEFSFYRKKFYGTSAATALVLL